MIDREVHNFASPTVMPVHEIAARKGLVRVHADATAISTVSTLVVLAILVAIFLRAPGSSQVRHTFFNPRDMWESFIGNPKKGYYSVGKAIWLNIRMFVVAEVLILIFALVIALIRQSASAVLFPFRVLALIYVDFFRGVPVLLVLLAIGLDRKSVV